MPYSVRFEDAACRYYADDEIYRDVKKEPSLYNVGTYCHSCDQDYGVLDPSHGTTSTEIVTSYGWCRIAANRGDEE